MFCPDIPRQVFFLTQFWEIGLWRYKKLVFLVIFTTLNICNFATPRNGKVVSVPRYRVSLLAMFDVILRFSLLSLDLEQPSDFYLLYGLLLVWVMMSLRSLEEITQERPEGLTVKKCVPVGHEEVELFCSSRWNCAHVRSSRSQCRFFVAFEHLRTILVPELQVKTHFD